MKIAQPASARSRADQRRRLRPLHRAEDALFREGNAEEALAVAQRAIDDDPDEGSKARRFARRLRLHAAIASADVDRMVRLADDLLTTLKPHDAFEDGNAAVNAYIAAGRYTAAIAAGELAAQTARGKALRGEPDELLMETNLAEADYNLGHWEAAAARLAAFDPAEWDSAPVIGAFWLQRAWIAAHHGDVEGARGICDRIDPTWFPPLYESELHFCRAMTELLEGRWDDALAETATGERKALRRSSVRNALFLRAIILAEARRLSEAAPVFAAAASHPYRGQGGWGLLAWGDCLVDLGQTQEAGAAFQLCLERDPESESAAAARRRLQR